MSEVDNIRKDVDEFKEKMLTHGESCYEECSENEMYLVDQWAQAFRGNPAQQFNILLHHEDKTDHVIKYLLAGYWMFKNDPDSVGDSE